MSNPASPLSSPPKGVSKGDEDKLWEEAFARISEQKPLFQKLPQTDEEAMIVFKICNDASHVGPIVVVKGVPQDVFGDWLRESELGLHKAEILPNGTVYIPQACAPDHGILRGLFHKESIFPILSRKNAIYLRSGSGSHRNQNPDVFWFRQGEFTEHSRVIFEVGIQQSLPDLRRRAYSLCHAQGTWENLAFVVLVKRYKVRRLYVEIWKRIEVAPGADAPTFSDNQRAPQELGVTETMEFVSNAHACDPGVGRNDALLWQFALPTSCHIPAGDDLVDGGSTVTFDAQVMLDECLFRDTHM